MMRAVVQRVADAQVTVLDEAIGRITRGLLVYLGVGKDDGPEQAAYLARKIATLRIFEDENGKMNLDVAEIGGAVLVISQFTLWGDTKKGRRPSYNDAAPPHSAIPLYEAFISQLRSEGLEVESGKFGATMQVAYVNDGPVTIILDTDRT